MKRSLPQWGDWRGPRIATCISFLRLRNKLPPSWCFEMTEIYCLTVQEARSLKSKCLKVLGKNPSLPLPGFWWLPAVLGVPWFVAASFQPLLPRHMAFSLCVSVCTFLSLTRTLALNLGPTQIQYDLIPIPALITSAKTLFPNEITFWGFGWTWILEGRYSTHYIIYSEITANS